VVLSVHVLSNVFVFVGVGESVWTTNAGLQRLVMWRAIAGAVVNVLLNLVLIPPFGALGAAVATLTAYAAATMVANAVTPSTRHLFAIELRSFRPRTIVDHWRLEYRRIREGRGRPDRSPGSIGGS
jgi:PST family polysaccharide transporter